MAQPNQRGTVSESRGGGLKRRFVSIVTLGSATGRYGGPYDTALRQAQIASRRGDKAILVAGYLDGDAPLPTAEADGVTLRLVRVRRVVPTKGYTGLFSFAVFRELLTSIRSADYVRISICRELIPIAALIIATLFFRPIVLQPHGMLTSRSSRLHRLMDIVLRPLVMRSAVIVALTEVERKDLESWLGTKNGPAMRVLGNPVPVDVQKYRDGRSKGTDAVFIARLHPRKRVDVFMEASKICQDKGWPESYAVVGPDDGDLPMLLSGIESGNHSLVYEGAVGAEAVTARVSRAGVFVLTSEAEPWGNVLAIALACGVPVVVPRSAALSRQIEGGAAGLVVPDGDAGCVADAIHRLLNDVDFYNEISRGALALAESLVSEQSQMLAWMDIQGTALARSL